MENEEDEQISRILRLSYVEKASFTTLGSATIFRNEAGTADDDS